MANGGPSIVRRLSMMAEMYRKYMLVWRPFRWEDWECLINLGLRETRTQPGIVMIELCALL
jgi:hypothetical protein